MLSKEFKRLQSDIYLIFKYCYHAYAVHLCTFKALIHVLNPFLNCNYF